MVLSEALDLALKKEEASIALYEKLANEHKEIRSFLLDLLNEEYKHKKLIQEKIRELINS